MQFHVQTLLWYLLELQKGNYSDIPSRTGLRVGKVHETLFYLGTISGTLPTCLSSI